MRNSKISILMPVLNVARFVAQAIESVLGQTHSEFELLIQDGESIDGTPNICSWYAHRDARIRILPSAGENRGHIGAFNALLAAHRGNYVTFLDGDDIYVPDRLERQLAFLHNNTEFAGVTTGIHFTDAALFVTNSESAPENASLQFRSILVTSTAARDIGMLRQTESRNDTYDDWLTRLAERHAIGRLELPLYCRRVQRRPYTPPRRPTNVFETIAHSRPLYRLSNWLTKQSPNEITPSSYVSPRPRHTLRIAVHEGWGDFEDSLLFLTTLGDGRWGPVQFAPAASLPDPDYHLVLNRPSATTQVHYRPGRLWFASGEPPNRAFRAYHEGQGKQTVVVTCDETLIERASAQNDRQWILAPPMTRSWHVKRTVTDLAAMNDVPKPQCLSWVTSNLTLLPGHDRRMKFLRTIRGRIPFDLYGRGFRKLSDKWDGIAPYRYSIAFENHRSSYYFTEKIMDCFVCLTMPIYFGSPVLDRFFPAASFVEIDPDDPDITEKILEIIHSDVREKNIEALIEAKWLVLEKYNNYAQLGRMFLDHDRTSKNAQQPPLKLRLRRVVPNYAAERSADRRP